MDIVKITNIRKLSKYDFRYIIDNHKSFKDKMNLLIDLIKCNNYIEFNDKINK